MHTEEQEDKIVSSLSSIIRNLILVIIVLLIALIAMPFIIQYNSKPKDKILATGKDSVSKQDNAAYWQPPEIDMIKDAKQKAMVEYGKDLIAHTSKYFGPNGSVLTITNGMNCQNCHL